MSKSTWILLSVVVVLLAACGGGGQAAAGNAANGDKLFHQAAIGKNNVAGCGTCHSTEPNKTIVGPTLAGIAPDAEGAFKESGYKGTAKNAADWLREAIVNPNVDVVEGFQPNVMPQNFKDELTSAQINDLVAYLQTLK
jgi:cytochrome c2